MKQILFYTGIILIALSFNSKAQESASMNLELRNYILSNPNNTEQLHVLVQGNNASVSSAIENVGGTIKFFTRDIASVNIEADKIFQLSNQPGIIRIEGRHGTGVVLDDQTDINTNVTPVKQGQSPLPQAYNGSGVVVGIIDDGIDITHPDFKDASGNTRIKYLWSQIDATGGSTPSYGYGQEWDSAAIDAGPSYAETSSYFGHGSIVSGIAAGNPPVLHQYEGVAPQSDLVVVAVDMGSNFLNNMVDATEYIYQKAQLLGKPCVINASVGTYGGSHDGLDLPAIAINNLITAHNGQSFVAAAGNAGDKLLHLQYPVEIDSAFTWFKYEPSISQVYYELWAYKSQFDNVQFALGADMTSPYTYLGRTNYYNILNDFTFTAGFAQLDDTLKTWNGIVIGTVTVQAETLDTTYHLAISIHTLNTAYFYRLSTKGVGQFDIWSNPAFTGTSNMVKPVNLPPVATFPDVARYRGPNQAQTIVSSFQCSDKVITVANFVNRNTWVDVNSTTQTTTDTVGARGLTSSIGPTRDGKIKPDISAPGNNTFGAGLLSLMPTFISSNPQKVSIDSLHILDGGTSMASPVVAGIIALYLQRYPTLDWLAIKNAVIASAVTDSFTTANVPNMKWGFGKIDAFKIMDTVITNGCQATNHSYGSFICQGDVYDFNGATLTTAGVYHDTLINAAGCDSIITFNLSVHSVNTTVTQSNDSLTALTSGNIQWLDCNTQQLISGATQNIFVPIVTGNYAAIINEQGCSDTTICYQVFTGINSIENNFQFSIYPNPVSSELTIYNPLFAGSTISITDVTGREIFQSNRNTSSQIINLKSLSPGIYSCLMKDGQTILAVRKFVKI